MNIFWERMYLTGHKAKCLLNSRVLDQQKSILTTLFWTAVITTMSANKPLCARYFPHLTGELCQVLWVVYSKSLQLCPTLWTVAWQAPLSMGFLRQKYCNGVPFPSPGDLPNSGIEPVFLVSPELAGGFLTTSTTCEALLKSESEVAQSCPTLCDPIDCSLPGSSIHGIFQAKSTGVGCHCLLLLQVKSKHVGTSSGLRYHSVLQHWKCRTWDFTGGPVIKRLPCNAGDVGSIPGQWTKVPHATEKLSWSPTTTEPAHSGVHEQQLKSSCTPKKILCAETKTQCSQIHR